VIPAAKITESSWSELLRAVRSYVGRRVSHPEDRDDLVQEVLLRVHRGLGGLKGQTAPGPWIYSIAHNAIIDHWRKRGRVAAIPVEDAEGALGELPAIADDGDQLQQAVAAYLAGAVHRLESPYRETLTLTELQGMKYADAARQLGISLPAVKSRVLRGRQLLRQAVQRCCEIELGPTGRVVDCAPRGRGTCPTCAAGALSR
jgi:RNA polymerase sigma-70 factor (ECF subfamily)